MRETNRTYNKMFRTAWTMLCVTLFVSCVKVDLCTQKEHSHAGNLKFIYHWDESTEYERPDSMLVLVNRLINNQRVGYISGAETSEGGYYCFGKEFHDGSNHTTDEQEKHPLKVSTGEYQAFAFSRNTIGYQFDNLNEYGDTHLGTVNIYDLGVSYVRYELSDPQLNSYGTGWTDFNPYTGYIATDVKPIYRATNKYNEATQANTFNVRADEEVEVHLAPQKITQDITFAFPIYTDEEVVIDSVIAEISGIPQKMFIYTGVVVIDTTYKILFKIDVDKDRIKNVTLKIKENEKTYKQLDCMSTISVIGLIANEDPTVSRGAGILQLCIHAHVTDAEGNVKSKAQHAKINMHSTIKNAHSLITDEQGRIIQNPNIYPDLPRVDTLRIEGSHLIITKNLILETYDDNNSLDSWIKGDNGDENGRLDIEI